MNRNLNEDKTGNGKHLSNQFHKRQGGGGKKISGGGSYNVTPLNDPHLRPGST